jgi:hypothetical protein
LPRASWSPSLSLCCAPIVSFRVALRSPFSTSPAARSFSFHSTWFRQSTAARSRVYGINFAHQVSTTQVFRICRDSPPTILYNCSSSIFHFVPSSPHLLPWLQSPIVSFLEESSPTPSAHQLATHFPQSSPLIPLYPLIARDPASVLTITSCLFRRLHALPSFYLLSYDGHCYYCLFSSSPSANMVRIAFLTAIMAPNSARHQSLLIYNWTACSSKQLQVGITSTRRALPNSQSSVFRPCQPIKVLNLNCRSSNDVLLLP